MTCNSEFNVFLELTARQGSQKEFTCYNPLLNRFINEKRVHKCEPFHLAFKNRFMNIVLIANQFINNKRVHVYEPFFHGVK